MTVQLKLDSWVIFFQTSPHEAPKLLDNDTSSGYWIWNKWGRGFQFTSYEKAKEVMDRWITRASPIKNDDGSTRPSVLLHTGLELCNERPTGSGTYGIGRVLVEVVTSVPTGVVSINIPSPNSARIRELEEELERLKRQ